MVGAVFLRSTRSSRAAITLRSNRRFSSSSSSGSNASAGKTAAESEESIFARSWKIPAASGFALIAFLQFYHLNNPTEEERKSHPAPALKRLPGAKTAFEETMATQRQLESLKLFPYRAASRLWGEVHDKELPMWLRAPLYKAWTFVFNCKLDEMRYPLDDYCNLGEFFSRPLKDGAREFDANPNHIASPVDGTVASIGVIDASLGVPTLEQIKGARYRLDEFLGDVPAFFTNEQPTDLNKKMYHCVLYLAPGDYHRIHAPIDWQVAERRHFPGNLFPVNKIAARLIPSLFVENERVALLGEWKYGFFSLTAVGATNVGSIVVTSEPDLRTNTKEQDPLVGKCLTKQYEGSIDTARGEEMAQFKLGSTVVLVFEAPDNFEFTIKPGDKHFQRADHVAAEIGLLALPEDALEMIARCLLGFELFQMSHVNGYTLKFFSQNELWTWRFQAKPAHRMDMEAKKSYLRSLSSFEFPNPQHARDYLLSTIMDGNTMRPDPVAVNDMSWDTWFSLMGNGSDEFCCGTLLSSAFDLFLFDDDQPVVITACISIDRDRNLSCSLLDSLEEPAQIVRLELERWYHLAVAYAQELY